jgi:hypothetical protein
MVKATKKKAARKQQVKRLTRPKRTASKRLTPSGNYRYYDLKTGRRIAKAKYYSRLVVYHQKLKVVQPRKPRRRSAVTKTSYEGKFTKGFNFSKKVSIWLEEYQDDLDTVITKVRRFYDDCRNRFKFLSFCYINFKAKIFLDSGTTENFFINTRVSFPKQYDDSAFFFGQVRTALEQFLRMIEDTTHSGEFEDLAEKVHLTRLAVHTREDKSFKIERR